jgi:drug/metabolite transporter (DMT)-like permease
MLMGCACFTVMYAFVEGLRDDCDWQIIALARTALAFLFAVILAWAAGAKLVFLRPPVLWVRSLAGSMSLLCAFFAMTRDVPVSNVLAITNVFPIWVALLAWPTMGVKPGWSVLVSVVTAVAGVFLIRPPQLDQPGPFFDLSNDNTIAAVFALAASFFSAVAMLGLNRLHWIDTRAVVAHFSGVAAVFCLVALVSFGSEVPLASLGDARTLRMLLAMGVAATAGQICLTKAFTIGLPSKVSIVSLSQVVMMLGVDVWLFENHFSARNLLGIALVMLPTAWIVSGRWRRARIGEKVSVTQTKELPCPEQEVFDS